jgi:hypothetical protein
MNLNVKYLISKYGLDLTRVFLQIISKIQQFLFFLWDNVPWGFHVCFLCMNERDIVAPYNTTLAL